MFPWKQTILACLIVLMWQHREDLRKWIVIGPTPAPAPKPVPIPAPAGAEEFRIIFARNTNREQAQKHAAVLGEISQAAFEVLEYDWKDPKPTITTGYQVAVLRRFIRDRSLAGWSYLKDYPELGNALNTFFTSRVGQEPGVLSADDRQRWLKAFSELSDIMKWVSQQ